MSKRVSYDIKALTKTFVDGGVTCKDIRYFLGISERTVKRHFKRGKGRLRGGFHLNQTQKEAIVDLHHKGCDIFEISRQIELPAKYVLKFIANMTEEGWTVKPCPACRALVPARVERPPKPCAKCSRSRKESRKTA